jgi:Xaa-Pro aminopeptidase
MKTGYFGDMTRTVVKGKAHPKLKKMYDAVRIGQDIAFENIHDGIDGRTIHSAICDLFIKEGFKNIEKEGNVFGFIHGTGHGLGLEIHEPPRISAVSTILKTGNVTSVEPGLYYDDVGGIRIEDIILVKDNGCEILTKYPRELEVE